MKNSNNPKKNIQSNTPPQEKTRVDRALIYFKNHKLISFFIIVGIAVMALAAFTSSVKNLTKDFSSLWESEKKNNLSEKDVEDWAKTIDEGKLKNIKDSELQKLSPEFRKLNNEVRSIYAEFILTLKNILLVYQKNNHPNLYLNIPDLPLSLFSQKALEYKAGVIFSENAAWSIFLTSRSINNSGHPTIQIHFMNGDGHTKGGVGIGLIELWYDLKTKVVTINSSGVGELALSYTIKNFSANDFKSNSPEIIKSIISYELLHL